MIIRIIKTCQKISNLAPLLGLIGVTLLLIIIPYEISYSYFSRQAAELILNLLPGYKVILNGAQFKREFIVFVLLQSFVIALIGLFFLLKSSSAERLLRFFKNYRNVIFLTLISLLFIVFYRDVMVRLIACFALFFLLFNLVFINNGTLALIIISFTKKSAISIARIFSLITSLNALFLILVPALIAIVLLGKSAWYPLTIPNDYYEISDQFRVNAPANDEVLSRKETQKYLEEHILETPKTSKYQQLISAIGFANGWQSETGRILYHHSYLFIPAQHFLKYGFDRSIPYLYGYGNTILHAGLMKIFGENLSGYFYSYPLTLLLGILCIAVAVGYCAKNRFIFSLALLLCIYEVYTIGFTPALLAASFNPARYIGLTFQFVSVFYFLRKSSMQNMPYIYLALLFSIFWNKEFAFMGLTAQCLALFSPQIKASLGLRLVLSATLIILFSLVSWFFSPNETIINTTFLGFFQVNMPILNGKESAKLLGMIVLIESICICMALTYKNIERYARLCIVPALFLTLIKVVYNPSAPHLAVTLAFFLPFTLLYIPQTSKNLAGNHFIEKISQGFRAIVIVVIGISTYYAGQKYLDESNYIRKYTVAPFVSAPWSRLGESLKMVADERLIADRVKAIKSVIKPTDQLLVLSPFDHLLSFYLNPPGYCGHFEVISNLTRNLDAEKIISCVQKSPNLLVVYDKLLLAECPNYEKLGFESNCGQKLMVKKNVSNLIKNMPDLIEVGRDGDLIYYRSSKRSMAKENP